jgi:predicted nucleic-acid-binding Zn-ribbon protein
MKKSGRCPKCESNNLIVIPGSDGVMGRSVLIGMTVFSGVSFERFVCSSCGYSEEWFDHKAVEKLQNKFWLGYQIFSLPIRLEVAGLLKNYPEFEQN